MKWKKWNTAMLIFAMISWVTICGVSIARPMAQAEAVAEQLASKFDVDEDMLRKELDVILASSGWRQAIIFSIPILVMIGLVVARAITEKDSSKQDISGNQLVPSESQVKH